MVIPTCSVSFSIIVCRYFSKWRIFCFLKTEKVASTPSHPLTLTAYLTPGKGGAPTFFS